VRDFVEVRLSGDDTPIIKGRRSSQARICDDRRKCIDELMEAWTASFRRGQAVFDADRTCFRSGPRDGGDGRVEQGIVNNECEIVGWPTKKTVVTGVECSEDPRRGSGGDNIGCLLRGKGTTWSGVRCWQTGLITPHTVQGAGAS
jgi:translation elongation factor EF-Tu-like GTPase